MSSTFDGKRQMTRRMRIIAFVTAGSDRVAILTVFRGLLHEVCD